MKATNVHRFTPLHSATHFAGHLDIVKYLLEHGAAVDATDQNGWSALLMAAAKGDLSIVSHLVESANADVNKTALANHSALLVAACNGHESVVRYLLSKGSDVLLSLQHPRSVSSKSFAFN